MRRGTKAKIKIFREPNALFKIYFFAKYNAFSLKKVENKAKDSRKRKKLQLNFRGDGS
jgi:hypothetical protein